MLTSFSAQTPAHSSRYCPMCNCAPAHLSIRTFVRSVSDGFSSRILLQPRGWYRIYPIGYTRPSAYVPHGTSPEPSRTKQTSNPRLIWRRPPAAPVQESRHPHARPHGQQTTGRTTNVQVIDPLNASSRDTRVTRAQAKLKNNRLIN